MRYLLLLVLVGASRASTFPCAPGIDYPDGDLPNMPLPLPFIGGNASSEALCAAMCVAEPACVASVTLDPGCAGGGVSAALCYLKGTQTPAKQQPCRCGAPLSRAPVPSAARSAQRFAITTPHVAATFDARGLLSVTVDGVSLSVQADTFALALDAGVVVNSSQLPDPAGSQPTPSSVQLVYSSPPYTITVLYEVRAADWRFLRKALSVAAAGGGAIAVGSVSPWDVLALTAESALAGAVFPTGTLGTYGVFGRFADGTGIALVAENPFLYPSLAPAFSAGGALAHVGYHPALLWNQTTPSDPTPRPFVADAGLLGLYALSPNAVPPAVEANAASPRFAPAAYRRPAATAATDTNAGMLVEFEAFAGGGGALPAGVHLHFGAPADASWLNYAERDAFRAMGEAAFAAAHGGGAKPLRVHIPWTENDYQIDISNATQWAEYVRILTQLSRMDVPRLLYAGGNGAVSSVADCEDGEPAPRPRATPLPQKKNPPRPKHAQTTRCRALTPKPPPPRLVLGKCAVVKLWRGASRGPLGARLPCCGKRCAAGAAQRRAGRVRHPLRVPHPGLHREPHQPAPALAVPRAWQQRQGVRAAV